MAIWQFTFHWVRRSIVENLHGVDVIVLDAFRSIDFEEWEEESEMPNYWRGQSPHDYQNMLSSLLQPRESWSQDALMFGEEKGDSIELWDDDVRIRLDIREYNQSLAQSLVGIAAADDLQLVMSGTGRLIPPSYEKLRREIENSRAFKYVTDPEGTLRMLSKEFD
jgi:hypothetical protein